MYLMDGDGDGNGNVSVKSRMLLFRFYAQEKAHTVRVEMIRFFFFILFSSLVNTLYITWSLYTYS